MPLTLTTEDDRVVRRELCVFLETEEQVQEFARQAAEALRKHGRVMMAELWSFIGQPVCEGAPLKPPTEDEETTAMIYGREA